ncbi:MAG: OmpA family protein [Thermodesulfobacteriota bacterium]|nr:OmpA family protein [Thermodesulfobacteriota bacterium]
MLKKTIAVSFVALCIGTPAMGIEFPQDASPSFSKAATAYSSQHFNRILQAYELQLDTNKAAQLPTSYAKFKEGNAFFNATSIAYSPKQYHAILTAYGLQLTLEDAQQILKTSSYAKVTADTINFSNTAIAYGGPEWNNIMSAYSFPPTQQVTSMPGDDDRDGVTNDKDDCPDTPYKAVVDDRGCWAFAHPLYFDFDSAVVKKEFAAELDKLKEVFDAEPELKVRVDGHTDSKGSEAYNQNLSERRAQAVVQYLTDKQGIAAEKMTAVGHGEIKPGYTNDTAEGRAKNRRVEFTPVK